MGIRGVVDSKMTTRVLPLLSLVACSIEFVRGGDNAGTESTALKTLTPWNFDEHVGGENHVVAMFYAPWCGACKKYLPKFDEVADAMRSVRSLKMMKADVTEFEYEELQGRLNVSKVPAIRLFTKKSEVSQHLDPREGIDMQIHIKEKLGLPTPNKCLFGDSDAPDVTASNFDKVVMDPKQAVLVEFFAPWCKHCQNFRGTYNIIARRAASIHGIHVVRVNVDKEKSIAERYGVKKLPTLMIFSRKNKSGVVYELPSATEHLEMVSKIITRLQVRETDASLEAEATALLQTIKKVQENEDVHEALRQIAHHQESLNITDVWGKEIRPLHIELREAGATKLKEKALALAEKGNWKEAIESMREIQSGFGDTVVAGGEDIANMMENFEANLKALKA